MNFSLKKALRYWHTVRYLKPLQIYGQVRHLIGINQRQVRISGHHGLRTRDTFWTEHSKIQQSLEGNNLFTFLNISRKLEDWNDHSLSKLWLYNLHYFDDLKSVNSTDRKELHLKLITQWINENKPFEGNGWEPYPTSIRIVNWIKWSLSGNNLDDKILDSLFLQSRYLANNIETHLYGNHLFTNAKALCFSGMFFKGKEANSWLDLGLKLLRNELAEQILPDGGHFELSPMYHSIITEDLLDLLNIEQTYALPLDIKFRSIISKMLFWLKVMLHPDGDISFFNDAAFSIAPKPNELFLYAERMKINDPKIQSGLVDLSDSGYSNVNYGNILAIIDRANVLAHYIPGHTHADSLSFELSIFKQRVVVNSGTSTYDKGPQRDLERGTSSHSTILIDKENSSEVWAGFRVARRAQITEYQNKTTESNYTLYATHNGYQHLKGSPTHQRVWNFTEKLLLIEDTIKGSGQHHIDVLFHLHPAIEIIEASNSNAKLKVNDQPVSFDFLGKGKLYIEDSNYFPEFGLAINNKKLVYRYTGSLDTEIITRISW